MPDYLIRITAKPAVADAKPTVTERLVRAGREATALQHVVTDTVSVARASTDDIVRLTKAGVEVEVVE